MPDLLSSLERLKSRETIASFRRLFAEHGALGYGVEPPKGADGLTEADRLTLVPLVFGLVPIRALLRERPDDKVKPLIIDHLTTLGVDADELLVDILKSVADQLASTWKSNAFSTGVPMKRKMQIADLRALGHPYRREMKRQMGRCATCGALFDGTREEQLDHVIPWRLIGDVRDGSNWQILCSECNTGKGSLLTTLLSPEAWGWLYVTKSTVFPHKPTPETRYVVLAQRAHCERCGRGPSEVHLEVAKATDSGLPVADNLIVLCDDDRSKSRPHGPAAAQSANPTSGHAEEHHLAEA